MKIKGIKSICCGSPVKLKKNHREIKDDKFYVCQKCKKDCEAYFIVE